MSGPMFLWEWSVLVLRSRKSDLKIESTNRESSLTIVRQNEFEPQRTLFTAAMKQDLFVTYWKLLLQDRLINSA